MLISLLLSIKMSSSSAQYEIPCCSKSQQAHCPFTYISCLTIVQIPSNAKTSKLNCLPRRIPWSYLLLLVLFSSFSPVNLIEWPESTVSANQNEIRAPAKLFQGCPAELMHNVHSFRNFPLTCRVQPPLAIVAYEGLLDAMEHCREEMRFQAWDCSQPGTVLNTPTLLRFGVAWGVAQACAQGWLEECKCVTTPAQRAQYLTGNEVQANGRASGDWEWSGCSYGVQYGVITSKKLLTRTGNGKSQLKKLEKHNLKTGRLRIGARTAPITYTEDRRRCFVWTKTGRTTNKDGIDQVYFRCSGCLKEKDGGRADRATISWVKFNLTSMEWIGDVEQYDHVCTPKNVNEVSGINARQSIRAQLAVGRQETGAQLRAVKKTLISSCKCHGVSGSCQQRTCWKKTSDMGSIAKHLTEKYRRARHLLSDFQKPKNSDLVFTEKSPDSCSQLQYEVHQKRSLARICNWRNETHSDGSCNNLCCGQGYTVSHEVVSYKCDCKFIWCCKLECNDCLSHRWVSTCNN